MSAATPAERKRKQRQTRREAGLVRFEVWTTPQRIAIIKAIAMPTQQELIVYLRRWLEENS